jgi:hypothetical protein
MKHWVNEDPIVNEERRASRLQLTAWIGDVAYANLSS